MHLTTPRLHLRGMRVADAPFVLALVNDPAFILNIGDRHIRTLDAAQRYIESGPWTKDGGPGVGLRLVQRRGTGEAIGICGLLKRESLDAPDIGFAFMPAHRSQGFAFEAASAVLADARARFGYERILAIVSPGNAASIRLLGRLGLRRERTTKLSEGSAAVDVYAVRSDTIPPPSC